MNRTTTAVAFILLALTAPLHALDEASRADAEAAVARGFDFLRTTQNPDGSWTPQPGPADHRARRHRPARRRHPP